MWTFLCFSNIQLPDEVVNYLLPFELLNVSIHLYGGGKRRISSTERAVSSWGQPSDIMKRTRLSWNPFRFSQVSLATTRWAMMSTYSPTPFSSRMQSDTSRQDGVSLKRYTLSFLPRVSPNPHIDQCWILQFHPKRSENYHTELWYRLRQASRDNTAVAPLAVVFLHPQPYSWIHRPHQLFALDRDSGLVLVLVDQSTFCPPLRFGVFCWHSESLCSILKATRALHYPSFCDLKLWQVSSRAGIMRNGGPFFAANFLASWARSLGGNSGQRVINTISVL